MSILSLFSGRRNLETRKVSLRTPVIRETVRSEYTELSVYNIGCNDNSSDLFI
jgi:hypothetical protein